MEDTQAKQRKANQIKSTLPHRYQEELQTMEAGIGGRNNDFQDRGQWCVVVDCVNIKKMFTTVKI